jgi:hypothetical protein
LAINKNTLTDIQLAVEEVAVARVQPAHQQQVNSLTLQFRRTHEGKKHFTDRKERNC